ncbi:hypothetical protein FHG87_025098, partial [Trinorchestia longiramus]
VKAELVARERGQGIKEVHLPLIVTSQRTVAAKATQHSTDSTLRPSLTMKLQFAVLAVALARRVERQLVERCHPSTSCSTPPVAVFHFSWCTRTPHTHFHPHTTHVHNPPTHTRTTDAHNPPTHTRTTDAHNPPIHTRTLAQWDKNPFFITCPTQVTQALLSSALQQR